MKLKQIIQRESSDLFEAKKRIFKLKIINKSGPATIQSVSVDPASTELFNIVAQLKKSPRVKDVEILESVKEAAPVFNGSVDRDPESASRVGHNSTITDLFDKLFGALESEEYAATSGVGDEFEKEDPNWEYRQKIKKVRQLLTQAEKLHKLAQKNLR